MFLPETLFILLPLFAAARGEYLPGRVSNVPELSTFFNLLQWLYDECKGGDVTILAPTNAAFAAAELTSPDATSEEQLEALLRYHILRGPQPSASFAGSASFFSTLLNKACCSAYTNETSGLAVEGKEVDGSATVISALWSKSKITTGDIFFVNGGLIHTIDRVLDIPEPYAQTITGANLTDFVALGEHTQLAQSNLPTVVGVQFWPDLTLFAPNSPKYSTDFTGWDGLTLAQDLEIWQYHIVNGSVLYSSHLKNGANFTTASGLPVTAWTSNGDIYINNAEIIQPDLLQANGVIQVIDRPLDPNNTNARPPFAQDASTSDHSGLSPGAKVGIAIGIILAVLIVATGIAYLLIARRRKRGLVEIGGHEKVQLDSNGVAFKNEHGNGAFDSDQGEMATGANTWELDSRSKTPELSGGWEAVDDQRSRHELP